MVPRLAAALLAFHMLAAAPIFPVGHGSYLVDLGLSYGAMGSGFALSFTYFADQNTALFLSLTGGPALNIGFRAGMSYYPASLDYYCHVTLSFSNVNFFDAQQPIEKGGPVVTSLLAWNLSVEADTPTFNLADTEYNPSAYLPGQLYLELGVSRIFALESRKDGFPVPVPETFLLKEQWSFPDFGVGVRLGDVE